MKILRKANGEETIKMSKKEWENIGKMAAWSPWDDAGFEQEVEEDEMDIVTEDELSPETLKELNEIEQQVEQELGNEEIAKPEDLVVEESREISEEARIEALRIKEDEARAEREQLERDKAKREQSKLIEKLRGVEPIA